VDDELAFGMEQLAVPPLTMRKRVEEVLDLLGIAHLRHRDVATLSGGERQRVAVAAALALHPTLLVLDEPTSQLDPWGAEEVLTALSRLNEDIGITIVLAEHRLDRVTAHADRIRAITGDQENPVMIEGAPREVLARMDPDFLPPLAQVARHRGWQPLPLTIKEGRTAVRQEQATGQLILPPEPLIASSPTGPPLLTVHRVSAGYGDTEILRELDLEARPGEIIALMGRNGSGKTTLLRLMMGLHRPRQGRITLLGRDTAGLDPATIARDAGYVPQNPGSLLFAETLRDELAFTLAHHPRSRLDSQELLTRLGLGAHLMTHPRDLSGGERQRAALAAVLIGDPRLLLLDEPTRGMDGRQKRILAGIMADLRDEGRTVMLATHDIELVAATATRVILLGDGRIVADGPPRQILSDSLTYTTQVNKLFGGTYLTVADVIGTGPTPELS
jgi:energy-coupling factor transport system ATP-binding protein